MYRPRHAKHGNLRLIIRILLILAVAVCIIYPFREPYMIETEKTVIESSLISQDVRQIRIVFLSDIHEKAFPFFTAARFSSLVRSVNSLNPDIILLGGDYTESPEQTADFFTRLAENRLRANYGVFAVLGEHDRNPDQSSITLVRSAMIAAGVTPLINDCVSIRIGSNTINIAGLDDITEGWPNLTELASSITGDNFTIFLCHNPSIIPELMQSVNGDGKRGWFQLGLFGHTLGGQIAGAGNLLHLTNDVRDEYVSGWTVENRIHLLTSNGIGTVSVPARFLRVPQMHLITVRSVK